MGRPFTISFETFSKVLSQCLNSSKQTQNNDYEQLYESFKRYPRLSRIQLWEQMGAVLSKTATQVKNYFFNTWIEKVLRMEPQNDDFNAQEIIYTPFQSLFDEALM
ncbi:Hypothetical_protein [Hexamita inflata]|uniref:Hypothetical_protein n=1 Tax=Hexamita inflata TaxID=28002 RepID=A0AA86QIG4_9EUKA|nr:Hypothetical protein HINF_LOCUS46970 [Hexamita inflata]